MPTINLPVDTRGKYEVRKVEEISLKFRRIFHIFLDFLIRLLLWEV